MSAKAGRPNRREALEREQRFAELLAAGETPRKAGREARIDPWRAFKLASSIAITFDRYGHLMPGNEGEAAALVDTYLERTVRVPIALP